MFRAFCYKETLHILRDRKTLFFVVVIPAVLTLLFGFAISTDVNNIDVAVVAPRITPESREYVARLENNRYFTFLGLCTQNEAEKLLRGGKADAVVCFDYNGGKSMHIMLDASNTNMSSAASMYLQGLLHEESQPSVFETQLLYNPQMKSSFYFVPGILGVIFILICTIMTSVSIVREKETGTMSVLLVSPVRPITIMLAKMVPYLALSIINLVIILLLTYYILDVPMAGGIMPIFGVSLLYLVLALSLGLLISIVSRTQVAALLQCALLLLSPAILFSGMIYPLENLPEWLRPASWLMPATWYISAIRKLMIEGLPISYVLREIAIMAAMTSGILGAALKLFKDKME